MSTHTCPWQYSCSMVAPLHPISPGSPEMHVLARERKPPSHQAKHSDQASHNDQAGQA